jgi:hypothetical protein
LAKGKSDRDTNVMVQKKCAASTKPIAGGYLQTLNIMFVKTAHKIREAV